MVKTLR